ncbi:MAG: hypothetical protein P8N94_13205 [Gammaproteobacteria bacterium]|nr:hypothetical protein [Gammaproteobacteria bacterium]MDG2338918.1 hypothetical protein [Gammaproteobacteria bacterium]
MRSIGSQHASILTNHLTNALLLGRAAGAVALVWPCISLSLLRKTLKSLLLILGLLALLWLHLLKAIRPTPQALLSLNAKIFPLRFELLQYLSFF